MRKHAQNHTQKCAENIPERIISQHIRENTA